jgi:hypothetical protein
MQGIQDSDSRPAFSRNLADEVELRFWCPRAIVDVLDAVVMARGGQAANIHRGTVLVEVLNEWAEKKRHEAILIHRVAGVHPTGSERGLQELRVVEQGRAA